MNARTVGILGLGAMGQPIARNLVRAGFRVVGYDPRPEAQAQLAAGGGAAAADPSEVGHVAGVVLSLLPNEDVLWDAVLGVGGLAHAPSRGTVLVEMSTFPESVKLRLRDAVASAYIDVIDCPISGTSDQAPSRDLVVFASGPAELVNGCEDVFLAFARAVHHVGDLGMGTRVKLVANLLVAVHSLAAAEALVLAERAGLDPAVVVEAVGDGAGASRMLAVRGPKMARGRYDGGIRTTVFAKDVEAITRFAGEFGSPTPLFDVSAAHVRAALARGYAEADVSCVHDILRASGWSD